MAFILIVAFEAMLLGAFLIMLGYKVRKTTSREWLLYLTGGLSILFGILVIANPIAGSRTIVYMIASWSLMIGILKVAFGLKVRKLPDAVRESIAASR